MMFHDFDPYQALMDLNQNCQNLFSSMKELAKAHNHSQEQIDLMQQQIKSLERLYLQQLQQNQQLNHDIAQIQLNIQKDKNG